MKKTILALSLLLCCGLMSGYGCKRAQAYNTPTPSGGSSEYFAFKGVVVAVPYPDVVVVKLEDDSEVSVKLRSLESWDWKNKCRSAAREHLEQLTLNHQVEVTAATFISETAVCGWVEVVDVPDEYHVHDTVNFIMVRDGYAAPYKESCNLWKDEIYNKFIAVINKKYEDALFNAMNSKLGIWAQGKLELE